MAKKDPKIFLEHILECITEIQKYVKGVSEMRFARSTLLQDAVMRRLELIGADVKKLPEKIKENNKDVPWKQISGSRDILAHDYFDVDFELLWQTIKKDLPQLKKKILVIIKDLNQPPRLNI